MNGATSVTSVTRFTRCGSRAGGLLSLLSRCPRVRKERGRAFSIFFVYVPVPTHARSVTEATKGPRTYALLAIGVTVACRVPPSGP
jgi:hypothetical protein